MSTCSSPLPFFDQWHGEGKNLLLPYLEGRLGWQDLVAPHNQHRILLTRLLVLGLFSINGQWDAQVEMIAAALVHVATAVLLGWLLIRRLDRRWQGTMLGALVALFALPFDWEDTLSGGFQSQIYFLILGSIAAIAGMAHRPGTMRWWVGVFAAALAWFSVASGFVATVVIAGWSGLLLWRGAGVAWENRVNLWVAVGLTAAGVALVFGLPVMDSNHALSVADFLTVFTGLLSWPVGSPAGAAILYLPWSVLLWRGLCRPGSAELGAGERLLLPLGAWVILQAAVLAFARNRHADPLAVSRYMAVLAPGVLVNLGCLAVLSRDRLGRPALAVGAASLWAVSVLFGLGQLTRRALSEQLPEHRAGNERQRQNIAAFLASGGNDAVFAGKTFRDLHCDFIPLLAELLREPKLRNILPAVAQPPLPMRPTEARHFEQVEKLPRAGVEPREIAWLAKPVENETTVFRSAPLSTRLPWLEFAVSGPLLPPDSALFLVSESGATPVVPDPPDANTEWAHARVRAPRGEFRVEAVCRAGAGEGFVFCAPRELGRLSAGVPGCLAVGVPLIFAGLALAAVLTIGERLPRGRWHANG